MFHGALKVDNGNHETFFSITALKDQWGVVPVKIFRSNNFYVLRVRRFNTYYQQK